MPKETAVYTHGHHESVLRSHRWRTAANSAAYLLDELRPGQAALDVGCGPGTITADLAALVAPGRVTAVDTTQDILGQAAAVAAERGLENVEFTVADVHALDFPDDSFDVVHAHQVLQHVGDPVQALREMRRVCRPGGVVAVRDSDYAAMTWYPETPGLGEWQEVYGRVASGNGGEPDMRPQAPLLGAAGRFHRHHPHRGRLVLRHPGEPRLVERPVGGPYDGLGLRRAGRTGRACERRAARGRRRGVARLGRRGRRLVHGPARRGAVPGVR